MRTQTRMLYSIHVLWCTVCTHVSVCLALQFHAIRSGGMLQHTHRANGRMRAVTLCTHVFMLLAGWLAYHLPSSEQVCIVRALCSICLLRVCVPRSVLLDFRLDLCCAMLLCMGAPMMKVRCVELHHVRSAAHFPPFSFLLRSAHATCDDHANRDRDANNTYTCEHSALTKTLTITRMLFSQMRTTHGARPAAVRARSSCLARRTVFATVD